jgi:hypothetical protein
LLLSQGRRAVEKVLVSGSPVLYPLLQLLGGFSAVLCDIV